MIKRMGYILLAGLALVMISALATTFIRRGEDECKLAADIARSLIDLPVDPALDPGFRNLNGAAGEVPKDCSGYFRRRGIEQRSPPADAPAPKILRLSRPIFKGDEDAVIVAKHSYCVFVLELERRDAKWAIAHNRQPLCG